MPPDATTTPIEQIRKLLFANDQRILVIRSADGPDYAEKLTASVDEVAEFLGDHPGQFCLQTFDTNGEPLAYIGLAAVLQADPLIAPTMMLRRESDGLRVAVWRLSTPIAVADTRALETLEDIARGLGNDSAGDPAPLPGGVDGWVIADITEGPGYSLETMKLAPVRLSGTLDKDLMSRKLEVATSPAGEDTKQGRWKGWQTTVGDLLCRLGKHTPGVKGGNALLQGRAIDGIRRASAMEALHVVALDLDTGEPLEAMRERIRTEGWLALIYSTHSHLTPTSKPKKDDVLKHVGVTDRLPTLEEGLAFLRDVKRTQAWVLQGASLTEFKHEADGVKMVIRHHPLPKYRILLILQEPFYPALRHAKHAGGTTEWSDRYRGIATRLGVTYDRICVDCSHLFYTARHPAGAKEWHVEIIGGKALDAEQIERVRQGVESSVFAQAAKEM